MKIILLGAGLVGNAIARDLANAQEFDVSVVDINPENLRKLGTGFRGRKISADISGPKRLKDLIRDQDVVVSAVPGHMGFETLKSVIEAGKHVVDIAFFPEDMLELDALARSRHVVAIADMGVAPGMSNLLTGYADSILDQTSKVTIYVGGLPKIRHWPWEYRAVFSPADVIEEYTRPARLVENGRVVTRPALSDPELIDFPAVGTLEAFNSDGLRTLITTIKAPDMIEKTLRYPGHSEKIRLLRDSGFFSQDPVNIGGGQIRPIDLTRQLLFPQWKLQEGEEDLTIMQVMVEGTKNNEPVRFVWDLLDSSDPATGIHSMARTTGYAATMAVRMIAHRLFTQVGVSPPEMIGRNHLCTEYILEGLRERGVVYERKEEKGRNRRGMI